MRIAIDARGVNLYRGTGIGTYTDKLLLHLLNIDKENYYHLFWSGENYENYRKNNSKIVMASKKYHKFFEQNYFPANIQLENIDIYHVPQNGIGLYDQMNCKKIVTIHDLIPYSMPETVGKGYLTKFLREMPKIIECSSGIITVSKHSKETILKFFPSTDPEKIHVTHLAADDQYKPLNKHICKAMLKSKFNINKPFMLYLGGFSHRKNIRILIEAFSIIYKELKVEHCLVIVGAARDEGTELLNFAKQLNIDDKIIFTGYVDEPILPYFYNGCELFVYPSLNEGFGLPPLEAMSCGTAVITSNVSSMPEVVGDGGLLVNPEKIEELCQSIIDVLNDNILKMDLSKRALKRAALFSWQNTADETIKIYKKIYNEKLILPI